MGPIFSSEDIRLAQDLAHRIALAIDSIRLQNDLKAAVVARDEFLSIASHELNTPLTPLKLQIQLLMRTLSRESQLNLKPEKLHKILASSDLQLNRLSKLVTDLLDISRITSGKISLNIEEFDLVDLVNELVERFKGPIAESGCEISVHSAKKQIKVMLDRLRIEQVVVNLLTNALKYGSGKPVQILLEGTDHRARFIIMDNGIGISSWDKQRIFERFEQVRSKHQIGGLGLGLYIVRQILANHGGTIDVESEQGQGSRFIVDLPLKLERMEWDHVDPS
jgi:signal transduction histidine kinase